MKDLACFHLDGTDAITCNHQGPYNLVPKRGMPSEAHKARNERGPFLQCEPALEILARQKEAQNTIPTSFTAELQRKLYDELVSKQVKCTKYKDRE